MKKYSDEEILDFIRKIHAEHGYVSKPKWDKLGLLPSSSLIIVRFNSYLNAWLKAGIHVKLRVPYVRKWTRETVLKQLQKYEYRVSPRRWRDKPSVSTIVNIFGGWDEAWLAAQVPKNDNGIRERYWTILIEAAANHGYLSPGKFDALYEGVSANNIIKYLKMTWSAIWVELGYSGSGNRLNNVYTDEERQARVHELTTNPNWEDLSENERDTLLLIATGYSLTYIAKLSNVSRQCIKQRQQRGEQKLRNAEPLVNTQEVYEQLKTGLFEVYQQHGVISTHRWKTLELTPNIGVIITHFSSLRLAWAIIKDMPGVDLPMYILKRTGEYTKVDAIHDVRLIVKQCPSDTVNQWHKGGLIPSVITIYKVYQGSLGKLIRDIKNGDI